MADDHAPHLSETRARQGRWGRPVFWVLTISLILAVLALVGVWAFHWGPFQSAQRLENARTTNAASAGVGG